MPDEPGQETERADIAGHGARHIVEGLAHGLRVAGARANYNSGETLVQRTNPETSLRLAIAGATGDRGHIDGTDAVAIQDAAAQLGYGVADLEGIADDVRESFATRKMQRAVAVFGGMLYDKGKLSEDEIEHFARVAGFGSLR